MFDCCVLDISLMSAPRVLYQYNRRLTANFQNSCLNENITIDLGHMSIDEDHENDLFYIISIVHTSTHLSIM